MDLKHAASIADLREMARVRAPRFAFDFIDGGAESESNLHRNEEALEAIRLTPRYLVSVRECSLETEMFGKRWAAPFAIAPIGMLNVIRPGADLILARLAARENIPITASTAASTSLEKIAEAAEGNAWFQLYVANDDNVVNDVVGRAESAGYDVMMVTVDIPTPGKRDRDTRNGFQVPFKITPAIAADLAAHPSWTIASLRAGRPQLANMEPYKDRGAGSASLAQLQATLIKADFTREALKRLRDRWKGKLLVKGIMHADDAKTCMEIGCDGVIVSNHGGRQADYAPASIEMLPLVAKSVGRSGATLFDSGIRRGADIIRARALGADFTLLARAFAYGVGAAGEDGAAHAFKLIKTELTLALAQLGCPDIAKVTKGMIAPKA